LLFIGINGGLAQPALPVQKRQKSFCKLSPQKRGSYRFWMGRELTIWSTKTVCMGKVFDTEFFNKVAWKGMVVLFCMLPVSAVSVLQVRDIKIIIMSYIYLRYKIFI